MASCIATLPLPGASTWRGGRSAPGARRPLHVDRVPAPCAVTRTTKPGRGRGRGRGSGNVPFSDWASSGMRSFQTVPKWRQLSNKPEKIERDPEKLAKKAPDWMGFSAEDIATQQRLLASDKDDSAAAVPARVRKRRESHAGSERLAAASAARVRKTELLVARVVGPKGEPNYTAFATGQPQWWGVKLPIGDARKTAAIAKWLSKIHKTVGGIVNPDGSKTERVVEPYAPRKKIKAWNLKTNKYGTRTVAYQEGTVVFFRAVMDDALGEFLANNSINMSSIDQREENAGRLCGYFRKAKVNGVIVPQPVTDADLADARAWEGEAEVWDFRRVWAVEFGDHPPPPAVLKAVADAEAALAALKAAKMRKAGVGATVAEPLGADAAVSAVAATDLGEWEGYNPLGTMSNRYVGTEESGLQETGERVAMALAEAKRVAEGAPGWNVSALPKAENLLERRHMGKEEDGRPRKKEVYAPRGGARGQGSRGGSYKAAVPAAAGGGWTSAGDDFPALMDDPGARDDEPAWLDQLNDVGAAGGTNSAVDAGAAATRDYFESKSAADESSGAWAEVGAVGGTSWAQAGDVGGGDLGTDDGWLPFDDELASGPGFDDDPRAASGAALDGASARQPGAETAGDDSASWYDALGAGAWGGGGDNAGAWGGDAGGSGGSDAGEDTLAWDD